MATADTKHYNSPNARKSIPATRLCHSGGNAYIGGALFSRGGTLRPQYERPKYLIAAPSMITVKLLSKRFRQDDNVKRLVIRTRQKMAIQV